MTREVIDPLFRGDMAMICGMPDDATYQRMYRDSARDMVVFVFESEAFDPIGEGEKIPMRNAYSKSVTADVRKNTQWMNNG
jgi:hypothetical protein